MSMIVTVFGANGGLGAGVARRLARDSSLMVKAVFPSDCDQRLSSSVKESGAYIEQCDLGDVQAIKKVLSGSTAVFVDTVSNFGKQDFMEEEIRQGKNIADACAMANIQHVVYSTNLNTITIIGGAARHLVAKAEVEDYLNSKMLPLTCLIVPSLYEDLYDKLKPEAVGNNLRKLAIPMGVTPLNMISAEDVGDIVLAIINNKKGYLRTTHSVCGDKLTIGEMASILTQFVSPLHFEDKKITVHQFSQMYQSTDWGQDYANMFDFYLRVDQRYNMDATKKINPAKTVKSFKEWVFDNRAKLKKAFS